MNPKPVLGRFDVRLEECSCPGCQGRVPRRRMDRQRQRTVCLSTLLGRRKATGDGDHSKADRKCRERMMWLACAVAWLYVFGPGVGQDERSGTGPE